MNKFYKGLNDAIEYKRGKIHLRSEFIEIPERPAEYGAEEIKQIREVNHYSQGVFAKILNVSIKTVQSWESGTRNPSHAALWLIEIIDKGIYLPEISKRR